MSKKTCSGRYQSAPRKFGYLMQKRMFNLWSVWTISSDKGQSTHAQGMRVELKVVVDRRVLGSHEKRNFSHPGKRHWIVTIRSSDQREIIKIPIYPRGFELVNSVTNSLSKASRNTYSPIWMLKCRSINKNDRPLTSETINCARYTREWRPQRDGSGILKALTTVLLSHLAKLFT